MTDTRYQELSFPKNWPNAKRVQFINENLADPQVKSVELLKSSSGIVVRIWFVDHLDEG